MEGVVAAVFPSGPERDVLNSAVLTQGCRRPRAEALEGLGHRPQPGQRRAQLRRPRRPEIRDSQIRMPIWATGRVALVGDAAACPSLLAGQGSALAMVEAYVLAAELAAARGDHVAAFARYRARLGSLLRSKQDAARGLGLAFAPRNHASLVVRNTVMRLLGLPRVPNLVMGRS